MKANDLNDLQDQIVAGRHGEITIPYGGPAFVPAPAANATLSNGIWTLTGAAVLSAAVERAIGSTITSITSLRWAFNRGGAGTLTLKLRKRNIITGAAAVDVDVQTIVTGAVFATQDAPLNYTMEADSQLFFEVTSDNVAHVFHGVLLKVGK